jgi:predicted transglutaminase-like cysteine proteinase
MQRVSSDRSAAHTGLLVALVLSFGCAAQSAPGSSFSYFEAPERMDPWSPKIARWQTRERAIADIETLRAPAAVSDSGGEKARRDVAKAGVLRDKYFAFRAEHKRAMARRVAEWIQDQAKRHYVEDGALDHWATLEETLATNGDDCDGLELLTYHFLRDMGFRADEVFRAVVYRPEDGQHHMVTLWFESSDDPWVIDPTGAMTDGMPRMSEVPGWAPLKVFSETREFTARAVSTLAAGKAAKRATGSLRR